MCSCNQAQIIRYTLHFIFFKRGPPICMQASLKLLTKNVIILKYVDVLHTNKVEVKI